MVTFSISLFLFLSSSKELFMMMEFFGIAQKLYVCNNIN
ncbi:hypothetical protein ZEAMMB73_Zm00001d049082 [Zea mays]|uniref:Uncharacterized protein n=1 Tax=Zea mays TaxID=4577 RepID=A0A1D6PS65_MAIZE|nr:hypothetical protein ZEAMMB73_Zm00001d049082 [Zea mays]